MGLCKEAGQEVALHLRRPATTEEGRVGDEAAPTLARRGAAEQGGPVVPDAEEDFEEHVVAERCGRVVISSMDIFLCGESASIDLFWGKKSYI
jgi:hypothetical protein